jgi:hypothetical protein
MKLMFIDAQSKSNVDIVLIDVGKEEILIRKKLFGVPQLCLDGIKTAIDKNDPDKLVLDKKGLGTSYSTAVTRYFNKKADAKEGAKKDAKKE